jgi:hypothetical protein
MKKGAAILCVISFFLLAGAPPGDNKVHLTKENYPMAFTLLDLELFCQSMFNDDAAVFLKLRQQGRAWLSKAGMEVYIIENDGSGKIKIRPVNVNKEIWTVQEAVRVR